jgi:hypothetical protein
VLLSVNGYRRMLGDAATRISLERLPGLGAVINRLAAASRLHDVQVCGL